MSQHEAGESVGKNKSRNPSVQTWETEGWEAGVGRLWRISSGGGTGSTTGAALDGSLLTSKTSMAPVELFRWIWYFLCPLGI